ncbi:MAG: methyltransferase domain-containing protein [Rubrivivax sp.]|nr:methyltransferase domain-containing protein [Rubrivivax sp.]
MHGAPTLAAAPPAPHEQGPRGAPLDPNEEAPRRAPLDPRRGQPQLARWLRRLSRVFDLDAVRSEVPDITAVAHYYAVNEGSYRRYHSAEGAVHMALNPDGRFDPAGFASQLQRLEAQWARQPEGPPADVLELAFGQGYNLGVLLPRHARMRFQGIDLTPAHVALARERLARWTTGPEPRLVLTHGDFHHLPQAAGSIDAVFCIESFCHAMDLPRAMGEVARVLRPGGRFTLYDGYLPRSPQGLPGLQGSPGLAADEALAVELVAKGMAIDRLQTLAEMRGAAAAAGLELESMAALDREVMPNLVRLERLTGAFTRWPWFARRALARRPAARSRNVLAGCLMATAVSLGLISYRELVLRRTVA